MNRRWFLSAIAVLGSASLAHAQGQAQRPRPESPQKTQKSQKQSAQQQPGQMGHEHAASPEQTASAAVPHVTMSLAAIQSSQTYARGLLTMASEPAGWEPGHARLFQTEVLSDIRTAQEHLGHLAGVATARPDAQRAIEEATNHLKKAESTLQTFEPRTARPDQADRQVTQALTELDQAAQRLTTAAQQLGAPTELQSPMAEPQGGSAPPMPAR